MPALRICGRRWRLDSDDLAIPFALYVFLHVAALLTLVIIYLPSADTTVGTDHSIKILNSSNLVANLSNFDFDNITESCQDLGQKTFFTATAIYSIELLLEIVIIFFSFRGTGFIIQNFNFLSFHGSHKRGRPRLRRWILE